MLIKVQTHRMSSRWKLIDSVNKPEFDQKSDEFRSAKDLQDYHKRQHTMYDGRVTLLIFDDIFGLYTLKIKLIGIQIGRPFQQPSLTKNTQR